MTNMGNRHRIPVYNNPILNADWPDPDAVRVGGNYYLIASSFNRVPGLPVLHSTDLVDWEHVGHALDRNCPGGHFRAAARQRRVGAGAAPPRRQVLDLLPGPRPRHLRARRRRRLKAVERAASAAIPAAG